MASIKTVADAAGVSTATVSRVLSDKPHVRSEIRERVFAAVEKLDYRPNRSARNLRGQKSHILGLIVSDIRNPFFTLVSRAVEDMAYQHGFSIFLCNADEDPAKEALYLNQMRVEHVAGIILSPTLQTADAFTDTVQLDIPIVVIDRRIRHTNVDNVLTDNIDSTYKMIEHLLQDGHQRIGALFGIGTTGRERREGYLQALKNHGLKSSPALAFYIKPREAAGYDATMKLLDLSPP